MAQKILRKLNIEECFYNYKISQGEMINAKTFIIETTFSLYDHLSKINDAIFDWIKLHPCLSFQIKQLENNGIPQLFYVQANKELISSLKNVFILRLKNLDGYNTNLDDKYWHLILKNELIYNFKPEEELLWRLIILQISEFKYAFTVNIYHAISDGSNSFAIIQELLSLIEQKILNEKTEPDNNRIMLSKYEIQYPNDPREGFESTIEKFKPSQTQAQKMYILPDCLKYDQNETDQEVYSDGIYETLDGGLFGNIKSLVDKCQRNNTGHLKFKIDEQIFLKFILTCKKNNVKLNSVFELIICLAFKKLYCFYNENLNKTIEYMVTINTRPLLPIRIPNYIMNAWTTMYIALHENNIEENEVFTEKFWLTAQEKSRKLHEYIDNLKSSKIYNPELTWKLLEMSKMGFKINDVVAHFAFTNLGYQTSFINSNNHLKIKEYYTGSSFSANASFVIGLIGTCSIEASSYWTFSYNKKLFNKSAADKLIEFIQDFISKV